MSQGFYFVDDKDFTTNPCVEIGMYPQIDGKSGWQGCNLTEINGSKCTSPEEFHKACRAGSILGTLQAGYTDFKYLDDTSKQIFDREALLGVSVTGWMNNPDVLLDADVQREGAAIVKKVNKEVAKLIGINRCGTYYLCETKWQRICTPTDCFWYPCGTLTTLYPPHSVE